MSRPAILALEDGSVFQGKAIGKIGVTVGELIFNTAMTGYQEILTDPSYAQQMITFTYPHIGNVGVNQEDVESKKIHATGCVIRDLVEHYSNWRGEQSLNEYLKQNNIVAVSDVDTRAITHILRDKGAQKACIMSEVIDANKAIQLAQAFVGLENKDLAIEVSTQAAYEWTQSTWQFGQGYQENTHCNYHVVAYDFGVKYNILRLLAARGCKVTVVPATTTVEKILALQPDGVFLSNGPGDPAACDYAIKNTQQLLAQDIPIFGICLGFQILALACGAKTAKMKFGHHGANHPVIDLNNKRVYITSQNHGFAVDETNLPADLQVTHRSLFDNSLQGVRHKQKSAFGFQGHPEASPGPHDIVACFDEFINMMNEYAKKTRN